MATVLTATSPVGGASEPLGYFQAILNEMNRIGKPSKLANGSTVCKTVTATWDDSNTLSIVLS